MVGITTLSQEPIERGMHRCSFLGTSPGIEPGPGEGIQGRPPGGGRGQD